MTRLMKEISVPFGLAPAEQIVRPEGRVSECCGMHGIYVPSFVSSEALSSPSWFKQYQSEKMSHRSLNKETRFFFVCVCQREKVTRAEQNTRWSTTATRRHGPVARTAATNKVLTP
jgi:hypothetical protein